MNKNIKHQIEGFLLYKQHVATILPLNYYSSYNITHPLYSCLQVIQPGLWFSQTTYSNAKFEKYLIPWIF